ncbi:EI24 domain-containing protein [Dactylosporangium matsuzakiense]|uniref:Membrane protein n=1 Tax=Dactylosporangium matsuzakiense TaxID=53360 RepID=A0A9W6KHN5_9ACTN|nr:EI24 domain-containing protein [Dactylosporangium matsuzakiense]UWZ45557.1 EI24 domain-containing protein [Dactylosporangium matsuzakiense]GLL00441.1 membrane protein [Dactylosporangium matsuzakiense]
MNQLKTTGSEFFTGVRLLGKGFARYGRNPRLLLLGTIPAAITFALFVIGWVFLIIYIDDLANAATWFADDWSGVWRGLIEVGAGAAILVAAVLLSVLTFTALTLLIGDPFYESISEKIEEGLGGTPGAVDRPWYRTLWPSLVDSLRLVLLGVAVAVPLFLMGFIPVVGQTVVPVLNALVGGWLIALELTGVPFTRRGMRLADRRKILRANRALTLGFGIPVFLMLLIPIVAIVVIPAAVTGATLLTRRALGLDIEHEVRPAGPATALRPR